MRIRERFRPPPAAATWLEGPRRLYRFAALSVSKARADSLGRRAAALAFTTMVSLVPLLAALSFLGARWFDDKQDLTVELLSQILPYSEAAILAQLRVLVDHAKAARGIGFAVFIVAAMTVFTNIEATINRIWNVSKRRPFRSRLLSVTMILFWGPLVIGTAYSLLFYLEARPAFQSLAASLPLQLVPFVVTLLGLTMLYWLVPYTTVSFRSAFGGGLAAALLLEALRQGFGIYVDQVRHLSLIYGGFGLLFFFMVSIQLGWWIVLLGSEAAYSLQNAAYVASRRRPAAPFEGSWIALASLAVIAERFRAGKPVTPHELLAERMQLLATELADILTPLLDAGLLCESSGDTEGYLLACDPHELEVSKVFDIYESGHWELLQSLGQTLAEPLEDLRSRLAAGRAGLGEGVWLAELVRGRAEEAGEAAVSEAPVEETAE